MIKTEAGEKMKEENPIDGIDTIDGQELLRQELEKEGKKFGMPETPEMNMGGLMGDGMGVIIGIEAESGNEIPAGSKPEEVADDIPAMLSEGEYVVPADVVRWHGVKTFEGLRCEAKMGMGLMAQDGRIAEVDDEYEHGHDSPDYNIEEKDKPEVEKAEVEVVHAAEGVDVSPVTPAGGPYYGYKVVYDPVARRYVYKAVDPETKEYVTTQDFDPTKSTRYTPESLLGGVYGEEETTECPEGFYFDEEAGVCMPEEAPAPASVVQPDGGGDGPDLSTQYTRSVQNQFGYTRKTLPATAAVVPLLGAIKFAQNVNNATAVSEARKALGLEGLGFGAQLKAGFTGEYNEGLVGTVGIGDSEYDVSLGVSRDDGGAAGGGVYDISTGKMLTSPEEITAAGRNARTTLTVSEAQRRQQMAAQGADFPEFVSMDEDYTTGQVGTSPSTQESTYLPGVGYTATTFGLARSGGRYASGLDRSGVPTSGYDQYDSGGDGGSFTQTESYSESSPGSGTVAGQTPSTAADRRGSNAYSGESDNNNNDGNSGGYSGGGGGYGGEMDDSFGYAKGGMPYRKNKPKVATMKYSKGSK